MDELVKLKNILDDRFNLVEIKDLCFELGVDYDDLGAGGLLERIQELLLYLDKRNEVGRLVSLIEKYRPDIDLSFWSGSTIDLTARNRPAGPGSSISNGRGGAATFGCLVASRHNPDDIYILCDGSGLNAGGIRDGDVVIQPGQSDGGHPQKDVIAYLSDWTQPSPEPADGPFNLSAAIASVHDLKDVSPQLPDGNFLSEDIHPVADEPVSGFSRSNGLVRGKILSTDSSVTVPWTAEDGSQHPVVFGSLIETTPMMVAGDSGIVVFDKNYRPVGLGFAGNDQVSLFFPIERVLDFFEVDIVTEDFWRHHRT